VVLNGFVFFRTLYSPEVCSRFVEVVVSVASVTCVRSVTFVASVEPVAPVEAPFPKSKTLLYPHRWKAPYRHPCAAILAKDP